MKDEKNIKSATCTLFFGLLILLLGCTQMSEIEKDTSVGINGGFEVVKNGIPVNWLVYTPNTVPDGEFTISFDEDDFKEGTQSLKFEVKACSSIGGWKSPGFSNQFDAQKGSTYLLSFWIKNEGAEFQVRAGGVAPMTGDEKILMISNEEIDDWKQFEFSVPVREEFDQLRLEVNVLQPGTFWIDDIKIEKE